MVLRECNIILSLVKWQNQEVGGNPNSSSKIPSTATTTLVMSTLSIQSVFSVVFYKESFRELFNMSVFTRKLSFYCLSNEYYF